jgi:hypothetical protein
LSITGSSSTLKQTSNDDPFNVNTGVTQLGSLQFYTKQPVRFGATPVTVSVQPDDPSVVQVVSSPVPTPPPTPGSGQATITPGSETTANGALKLRAVGNGSTVIRASGPPQYITSDDGAKVVNVSGFAVTLGNTGSVNAVGAGLEAGTFTITRNGNYTAAATITVQSLTTTVCLVSSSGATVGGSTATVTIPEGSPSAHFWIQALEGAAGATYSTTPTNFGVQIGAASGTTFQQAQAVRPDGTAFIITVQLTDEAGTTEHPGQLISGDQSGQLVTTVIPPGSSTNVALLQFQPLATGTTTCSASGTGVISTGTATVAVSVTTGGC